MKLYYFDVYGRGEAIRALLSLAKVPFEDVRLDYEKFMKLKSEGKFEFGQIPVLENNGKQYNQTNSVLRYLGKQYGYYPTDNELAWKVDSSCDALADFMNKEHVF